MRQEIAHQLFEGLVFFFPSRFLINRDFMLVLVEAKGGEAGTGAGLVDEHPMAAVDAKRHLAAVGQGELFTAQGDGPDKLLVLKINRLEIIGNLCHGIIIIEFWGYDKY